MAQQIATDIYLVEVPIPVPLRAVNCYLFRGQNGWAIVDTGFHDEGAESAWRQAFADLSIRPGEVTTILVTHYHPDHYGAAGWLQQLTGAPVYIHDRAISEVERFWVNTEMGGHLAAFFSAQGMDAEMARQIEAHHRTQQGRVLPAPELSPIAEGEQIALGDRLFSVIWCPGHSDGLATFWCEEESLFLANDHILPKITPNISLWPGGRPNPLGDYFASLAKVESLPAHLVLTGHRQMVQDLKGRIAELREHHQKRLTEMEGLLGEGATGWEVCQRFFKVSEFSLHQVRFAMGETLAHLEYLRTENRIAFDGARYHSVR